MNYDNFFLLNAFLIMSMLPLAISGSEREFRITNNCSLPITLECTTPVFLTITIPVNETKVTQHLRNAIVNVGDNLSAGKIYIVLEAQELIFEENTANDIIINGTTFPVKKIQ